jgi:hypothetical protein
MATAISKTQFSTRGKFIAVFLLFAAGIIFAGEAQRKIFTAQASAKFQQAQARYLADATNPTNVWQFASATFDLAEITTSDTQRAALANQGIDACRQLIARDPKSGPAHYYLAMNLGQLARTKFLGALKLVKEMEGEFKRACELDPRFDHAGPERNLGLLFRDAPGWPASIGNKYSARYYSEQAVKLAPNYPANRLNLLETHLMWNEPDEARRQLKELDTLWPVARTNLTGEAWTESWDNWTGRREAARTKIKAASPPP